MKVENGSEFTVTDGLTVVTENGWTVVFYGGRFDVCIGIRIVTSGKPVSLLDGGYSIPSGVDTLFLIRKDGKVKLTETVVGK